MKLQLRLFFLPMSVFLGTLNSCFNVLNICAGKPIDNRQTPRQEIHMN